MHSHIDFGYSWQWTHGHLVIAGIALAFCALIWARKWSRVLLALTAAVALWAFAAFLVVRTELNMNGRMTMPTENFLASGSGRVLDMGAGSGRSSLMVLEARPNVTVVALDSFGSEYVRHFGGDGKADNTLNAGRERLLSNFRAAGVEQRATIQPGDMRQMPFEPASFDAVVSTYAIDHLRSDGTRQALGEAFRVLKPGGQFLLAVLTKDAYVNFAWGPVFLHSGLRGPARWVQLLRDAGFEIVEQGKRPATLYFLARRP